MADEAKPRWVTVRMPRGVPDRAAVPLTVCVEAIGAAAAFALSWSLGGRDLATLILAIVLGALASACTTLGLFFARWFANP